MSYQLCLVCSSWQPVINSVAPRPLTPCGRSLALRMRVHWHLQLVYFAARAAKLDTKLSRYHLPLPPGSAPPTRALSAARTEVPWRRLWATRSFVQMRCTPRYAQTKRCASIWQQIIKGSANNFGWNFGCNFSCNHSCSYSQNCS